MEEDVGIVINIKDVNTAAIKNVIQGFKRLTKTMNQTNTAGKKLNKNSNDFLSSMSRSLSSVGIGLNQLKSQMFAVAKGVAKAMFGVSASGIRAAAETEEANVRLSFSLSKIGKKYGDVAEKIDDISLKTILTRKDITNMVSDLAIQRIDIFDEALNTLSFTAEDGSKKILTALEAINDAVAFSGKSSKRVIFSIKEAVSEGKIRPGRQLSEDLNLNRRELVKWNAALKNAKTNQEAFNALMQLTAERVGGTTDALKGTLNFMLKQFDDFSQKLSSEIFGPSLKELTSFLQEVGDEIIRMVKAGDFKPIAEAIRQVIAGFMGMARVVLLVVKGVVAFTKEFPGVIGLLSAVATGVIIFTTVMGTLFALIAPFLIFISLFVLLAAALSMITGIGLILAPVFLGIAVAFAAVMAGLTAMGVLLLFNTLKAEGFMDMWDRIKIVFKAVVEGVKNMDDGMTHLSLSTARALDEKGLLGLVTKLLVFWQKMSDAFDSFAKKWESFGPRFKAAMQPAIEAAQRLAASFGIDLERGLTPDVTGAERTGVKIANAVAGGIETGIGAIEGTLDFVDRGFSLFDTERATAREIRKNAFLQVQARAGRIPVPNFLGRNFATSLKPEAIRGAVDLVNASELEGREDLSLTVRESLQTFRRAQRKRQLAADPDLRSQVAFGEAVGGGGDASAVNAPTVGGRLDLQGALAQLSNMREQDVGILLNKFQIAQKLNIKADLISVFNRLAKLIGIELAHALVNNPPKILIDGKEFLGKFNGDVSFDFDSGQ